MGVRLKKVLSVQKLNLSLKESVYLCYLGYFFNNFLPTSIGGDLVKAYYAGKKFNKKAPAFSGVFMDRLLAMLPFTFIPTCALLFVHHLISDKIVIAFIVFMFLMSSMMTLVLLNKNIASIFKFLLKPFKKKDVYKKITKFYDHLNVYRHHKGVLAWSLFLSLAGQSIYVVCIFGLAKAVGVNDVSLGVFFLLIPVVGIIGMLPSINGLGVREAGLVYLFKDYMPVDTAFAVSLLSLALLLGLSLIGALIYAFKKDIYDFKEETI